MAVNDIVEESADWTPEQVAAADARFTAAGTFTLSEIRRRTRRSTCKSSSEE